MSSTHPNPNPNPTSTTVEAVPPSPIPNPNPKRKSFFGVEQPRTGRATTFSFNASPVTPRTLTMNFVNEIGREEFEKEKKIILEAMRGGSILGNSLVTCSGSEDEMFESSNEARLVMIRVNKVLQKKISFCSNAESLVEFRSQVKFKINDEFNEISELCAKSAHHSPEEECKFAFKFPRDLLVGLREAKILKYPGVSSLLCEEGSEMRLSRSKSLMIGSVKNRVVDKVCLCSCMCMCLSCIV